jgi:Xaa-Pro aminopeptidase
VSDSRERNVTGRGAAFLFALLVLLSVLPSRTLTWEGLEQEHQSPSLAGIPISEYKVRRRALLEAARDGIVVLRGSTEEEFGEVGRFRQNSHFMYLTGVEVPGAFLLLNPFAPAGSRETLYLPARNPMHERWTGVQMGPGPESASRFGFEQVRDASALDVDIKAILASRDLTERMLAGERFRILTIIPAGAEARFSRERAFADHLSELVGGRFENYFDLANLAYLLGEMRRTKSRSELAQLQRAIDITGEAQRELARVLAPGRFEYELEAAILWTYLRNGALRAGFPSIVGSGVNSTILHYNANVKRIGAGDLVVVDIGAEYNYYTADITRTWPASGSFTPRQREVYQLVLDAQEAAAAAYKPGMSLSDLHRVAVDVMKTSPVRDRNGHTLESYFVHGLGHYLGMDVHDVGAYGTPLRPGDVITIEPGIYIQEEHLGVRIEDDYLVTGGGLVKLSRDIPSKPDQIEAILREATRR